MTNSAKKRSGCSKKTVHAEEKPPLVCSTNTQSVKRRPGRPKKTVTTGLQAEEEQLSLVSKVISTAKGPRKQTTQTVSDCPQIKVTKKGPGRPRKKTILTEEECPLINNKVVKSTNRGPGRPKKTVTTGLQAEEEQLSLVSKVISSAKGPRKQTTQTVSDCPQSKGTKKGPGRPRKKTILTGKCPLINKVVKSTNRGPGRPKNKSLQTEEQLPQVSKDVKPAKRGRGRPKKCIVQNREELDNSQLNLSRNSVNSKQINEKPTDAGICRVIKLENMEFEGLEVCVKREVEPCLIGQQEETPETKDAVINQTPPPQEFHPCPYCTTSFTEPTFLQQHVKYHHREEYNETVRRLSSRHQTSKDSAVYSCPQCSLTFHTSIQLSVHKNQAHPSAPPKKLYTCPVCARSFDYLGNLRNHCRSWHKMSVHVFKGHLRCSDCRRSFSKSWGQGPHQCVGRKTKTRFAHPEHTKPISLVIGVECQQCGKILKNPHSLRKHMILHSGKKPHVCEECGTHFADASTLRKHMNIHTGILPYECEVCKKKFSEATILRKHMIVHTGEKPYPCSECGKAFAYKQSLLKHNRTHFPSGETFDCSECGKSFSSKDNMKGHMRIHRKSHQCSECGLKVASLQILKTHMRRHTGERPYHCKMCDKRFKRLGHLVNHRRTHTGERPYKCDQCEAKFAQSGDLTKHKRIHTGEKPYVCTVCSRAFNCKGSLDIHSATHSDARPYSCEVCAKTFRYKAQAKVHKRIHTAIRPYPCLYCEARFKRSEHLKIHLGRCRNRKAMRLLDEQGSE